MTFLARLKSVFTPNSQVDNLRKQVALIQDRQKRMLLLLAEINKRLRLLEPSTEVLQDVYPPMHAPVVDPEHQFPEVEKNGVYLIGDQNAEALHASWPRTKPKLHAVAGQSLGGLISTLDAEEVLRSRSVVICTLGLSPTELPDEVAKTTVSCIREAVWATNPKTRIIWVVPGNSVILSTMDPALESYVATVVRRDGRLNTSEDIADEAAMATEIANAD